jgi:hypothetical protein
MNFVSISIKTVRVIFWITARIVSFLIISFALLINCGSALFVAYGNGNNYDYHIEKRRNTSNQSHFVFVDQVPKHSAIVVKPIEKEEEIKHKNNQCMKKVPIRDINLYKMSYLLCVILIRIDCYAQIRSLGCIGALIRKSSLISHSLPWTHILSKHLGVVVEVSSVNLLS